MSHRAEGRNCVGGIATEDIPAAATADEEPLTVGKPALEVFGGIRSARDHGFARRFVPPAESRDVLVAPQEDAGLAR